MSTQKEKTFLPSTFANVKTFDNGGEIINIDFINAKELIDFIGKNSEDNKFRIEVQKQKNDPSKASVTLNTWKPKPKRETVDITGNDEDSLPF